MALVLKKIIMCGPLSVNDYSNFQVIAVVNSVS
jgi:hypothetical protein